MALHVPGLQSTMARLDSVETLVYTPAEVSSLTIQLVGERRANPSTGVQTGIRDFDDYFLPLRPGQLATIIGRPSNYKSGLAQFIARFNAQEIVRMGLQDKEYVAYLTWEQAIEEMTLYELAQATGQDARQLEQGQVNDWEALMFAATRRGSLPFWLFGHSISRRRQRPRMTMRDAEQSLYFVEDSWGLRPRLIVLDYLQRIAPEPGRQSGDIRIQMIDNVDRAKDLALAMGCPLILPCQAGRQVDSRSVKLPSMGDGQECSNIEQSSDRIITVWMPKTSEPIGSPLPDVLNIPLVVTENLLLVSVPKQKMGPAGEVFTMLVEPGRNEIRPARLERINL